MDVIKNEVLDAALAGYLRFFDTTTALGGALFGAMIFLVVRAVGLVRDDDVSQTGNTRLLVVTGLCAILMIVLGFVAQNVVLSFSVELLRDKPFGGCSFPEDNSPATFFMDCHRKTLRVLVWLDLLASFIGVFCIGLWFILQSRRLSNE